MTGVWTAEGWLSVAVVLDLFSRLVVGWAMAAQRDADLVELALQMALVRRHPETGLLHHSDRGSQYTSGSYQALLAQAGIQVSMSGKGDCYDNAAWDPSSVREKRRVDGLAHLSDSKGGPSCRSLSTSKCSTIASVVTRLWAISAQ